MNQNYNTPIRHRQGSFGGNHLFGFGNPNNLQSIVDCSLSSVGFAANNFLNSFQQQLASGNVQSLYRQWFNANTAGHSSAARTNAPNTINNNTSNNVGSGLFENLHLKMELLKQYESLEFRSKLELRKNLPVMRQKNAILQAIQNHQVVLIVGDKGSGKSSQVPQMLLDDYILDCRGSQCRIICSELTKMSAITLAERVACERNESLGKSVGFHVRRESRLPRPNGSILYCANGSLLKELRKDPLLKSITVCILNNINEENEETKQIMGFLKQLLQHRTDFKIILLSNVTSEDTYFEYFSSYHVIFIQERTSVVDLTLDDASGEDVSSDDVATDDLAYATVSGRDKTKEQKAKEAYIKARAFIIKHRQLDPTLLTEKQKQLILRHKETVESYERANPPKTNNRAYPTSEDNDATTEDTLGRSNAEPINSDNIPTTSAAGVQIKRTISMDEPLLGAKRTRYCDDNGNDTELQIAVIDLSNEKGRISADKWLQVEAKLIHDMTTEKWSKDEISFDSVNWYRGIKVITCRNKHSLEFLKTAIAEVDQMWPNAKLKVVPRSTVPTFNYASVWIPPPVPPMGKILHLIKKQNDGLNTENWKIVSSVYCKKNFGKEFRLLIDGNSIKHIFESQCKIKFGLGSIRIRLHGY